LLFLLKGRFTFNSNEPIKNQRQKMSKKLTYFVFCSAY